MKAELLWKSNRWKLGNNWSSSCWAERKKNTHDQHKRNEKCLCVYAHAFYLFVLKTEDVLILLPRYFFPPHITLTNINFFLSFFAFISSELFREFIKILRTSCITGVFHCCFRLKNFSRLWKWYPAALWLFIEYDVIKLLSLFMCTLSLVVSENCAANIYCPRDLSG